MWIGSTYLPWWQEIAIGIVLLPLAILALGVALQLGEGGMGAISRDKNLLRYLFGLGIYGAVVLLPIAGFTWLYLFLYNSYAKPTAGLEINPNPLLVAVVLAIITVYSVGGFVISRCSREQFVASQIGEAKEPRMTDATNDDA